MVVGVLLLEANGGVEGAESNEVVPSEHVSGLLGHVVGEGEVDGWDVVDVDSGWSGLGESDGCEEVAKAKNQLAEGREGVVFCGTGVEGDVVLAIRFRSCSHAAQGEVVYAGDAKCHFHVYH